VVNKRIGPSVRNIDEETTKLTQKKPNIAKK
jgi:hypothetical protein